MWDGGTVPPKTTNAAGFYLLLLTSILNVNFFAQTISASAV